MSRKVIFIDWGEMVHRAIFSWYAGHPKTKQNTENKDFKCPVCHQPIYANQTYILVYSYTYHPQCWEALEPKPFNPRSTYTAMRMVIASLKRVGVSENDKVILAVDWYHGNWRKKLDPNYKGNRADYRAAHEGIDWKQQYADFNYLLNTLDIATPFYPIQVEDMESDDIMAVGTKYFKDDEVVLITSDADMEQLVQYPNCKILSNITKEYKIVTNPYKILAKKISIEKTDNLITPIRNESEYDERQMLVDLVNLPQFVVENISAALQKVEVPKTDIDLDMLEPPSIRTMFPQIYNSDKVISYEQCLQKAEKKKARKSKKTKASKKTSKKQEETDGE
jgi:hypothetical protein